MRISVVTGANRGLGLEFARQLAARGEHVIAGTRHPGRALALNELAAAHPGRLHVLPLDLSSDASVDEFARETAALVGHVDLLLNNAGVLPAGERFGRLSSESLEAAFRINAVGPLLLTERLAALLGNADAAVIGNISTTMGSIAQTQRFGTPSYAISKAALNMVSRLLGAALADGGATVLSLHPGWVRTDMGGERAPLAPAEAVAKLLAVLDRATPQQNGMFVDGDGQPLPW